MKDTSKVLSVDFRKSEICFTVDAFAMPIQLAIPVFEVIEKIEEGILKLKSEDSGVFELSLADDKTKELKIIKDGKNGGIGVFDSQRIDKKTKKPLCLLGEHISFDKIVRRIEKGIDRYLNDPQTKLDANKASIGISRSSASRNPIS